MILIRFLTGEENDGWIKPALLAALATVAMIPAFMVAESAEPGYAAWILFVSYAGVGTSIFLGCWLLLEVKPMRASLVACGFVVYKLILAWLIGLLLAELLIYVRDRLPA